MTENEYKQFAAVLDTLSPKKQFVFIAALRLFLECCRDDADTSAVLIVRHPMEDVPEPEWTLHISALNADKDDAYEILDRACTKVAADIAKEAPAREKYN